MQTKTIKQIQQLDQELGIYMPVVTEQLDLMQTEVDRLQAQLRLVNKVPEMGMLKQNIKERIAVQSVHLDALKLGYSSFTPNHEWHCGFLYQPIIHQFLFLKELLDIDKAYQQALPEKVLSQFIRARVSNLFLAYTVHAPEPSLFIDLRPTKSIDPVMIGWAGTRGEIQSLGTHLNSYMRNSRRVDLVKATADWNDALQHARPYLIAAWDL